MRSTRSLVEGFERLDAMSPEEKASMELSRRFDSLMYDHGVEKIAPLLERMERALAAD